MLVVYTSIVIVCLLTVSFARYLYLGWSLKKFLEEQGRKNSIKNKVQESSFIGASSSVEEVFVSGRYQFNNQRGLIVVVADKAGLIFKRFLLFNVLVEWSQLARITDNKSEASIYFNDNSVQLTVPWSAKMTERVKERVALFD